MDTNTRPRPRLIEALKAAEGALDRAAAHLEDEGYDDRDAEALRTLWHRIAELEAAPADPTVETFEPNELRTLEAGLLELAEGSNLLAADLYEPSKGSERERGDRCRRLAARIRTLADAGRAVTLGTAASSAEVRALLDARFEVSHTAGEHRGSLTAAAHRLRDVDPEVAADLGEIVEALRRWSQASDAFLAAQGAQMQR